MILGQSNIEYRQRRFRSSAARRSESQCLEILVSDDHALDFSVPDNISSEYMRDEDAR